MLQKFLDMSVERDEQFKGIHDSMAKKISLKQPKSWEDFEKLTEEQAKEALALKNQY